MARRGEEDPEVRAYRQEVASACRSLKSSTDPLMDSITDNGGIDRTKLVNGLRNQLTAAQCVLKGGWKRDAPEELAEDVASAKAASRNFLRTMREALDRIEREQPPTLTFQQVSALLGELDADTRPVASEMESARSRLAGEPCTPPAQSPTA